MAWLHQNCVALCKRYKCLMKVIATAVLRSKASGIQQLTKDSYQIRVVLDPLLISKLVISRPEFEALLKVTIGQVRTTSLHVGDASHQTC